MEAKASRNPGAIARRRSSFRELLAGLSPGARSNGNGAVHALSPASIKLDRRLEGTDAVALHRVPLPAGGRIDSLIIGPAGITVVDTSHYGSKVARVSPGGLRIGRRDRTDLIYGVLGQVAELREVLADTRYDDVPVEAAIVLSEVEGVPVIESFKHPRILIWGTGWVAMQASRPGPLSRRKVNNIAAWIRGSN
jgi:hypothetical protein